MLEEDQRVDPAKIDQVDVIGTLRREALGDAALVEDDEAVGDADVLQVVGRARGAESPPRTKGRAGPQGPGWGCR